jgi:hypothetical protein
MAPAELIAALATLRATLVPDPVYDSKHAIRVDIPPAFEISGYGGGSSYVTVSGFRSKTAALEAAPAIVAEIAAKFTTAALLPTSDPPCRCPHTAWAIIKAKG